MAPPPRTASLSPTTVLACLLMGEAAGEPLLGKAAVAKVVWNRAKLKFRSDGTISGAAFHPCDFDCFYYTYTSGVGYHRVSNTVAGAEAQCRSLLPTYIKLGATWRDCLTVATYGAVGDFSMWEHDPLFAKLGDRALNYYNPEIVPDPPLWVTPEAHLVDIGKHSFFKD